MDTVSLYELVFLVLILALNLFFAFRLRAVGQSSDMNPVLDRLNSIKGDVERLDRVVREDGEQARTGADERGRLLREEVTRSLTESRTEMAQAMTAIRSESLESASRLREEIQQTLAKMGEGLREAAKESAETQRLSLETMLGKLDRLSETNAQALEKLRESLQANLTTLRNENSEKLEQMRVTVDEKLQGTLEKRLGESFKQVSERLEAVHKGLGEMQTLATGVGDLKKVLTNVKVRGTWGETQLSNLLQQVFSPEQYHVNHATRPGSSERVEFAIRLPGRGPEDQEVLLPIDSKFPREDYERLVEASERGDVAGVDTAAKAMDAKIKAAARDIRDKYINPPHTTDFAILFLPTEGLHLEVLRRPGLAYMIQNDFRVTVMGPTTLHAHLNALQMGFRTLAVTRRSSEVWEILGKVKSEFNKYGDVLDKVKKKLEEATRSVDDVNVRHRAVSRSLTLVAEPSQLRAQMILGTASVVESVENEEID